MNKELIQKTVSTRGPNSRYLVREIFAAEHPEQFIRRIPAQSLHIAIRQQGLLSSGELVAIATIEQCRLLLDFDLWQKDRLNEDFFWEWLELPDQLDDLSSLQKFLKAVDLKLIALVISRYVIVETFEEPTDNPPEVGFFSPDKGYTWLAINIEDERKHFLLGRLLALIFETSAELFYQILAIPNVATPSDLEEQSFNEKSKRLLAEGIPDEELAFELNSPIAEVEISELLANTETTHDIPEIKSIKPLVYETVMLKPLTELIEALGFTEDFESELTLLMNAAIVQWQVNVCEYEEVLDLISRVKGTLNIGLELLIQKFEQNALELYKKLGLAKIYRYGLGELFNLRKTALKLHKEKEAKLQDAEILAVLYALEKTFPLMPNFLNSDGSVDSVNGKLATGEKAIERLVELDMLKAYLAKL